MFEASVESVVLQSAGLNTDLCSPENVQAIRSFFVCLFSVGVHNNIFVSPIQQIIQV